MQISARQQVCEIADRQPLHFTWVGIIDPDDVSSLFEEVRKHVDADRAPRLLWDMSQTHLIPAETRRRLLDELVRLRHTGAAVVTTSIYVRIPVTMVLEVAGTEIPDRPPYRFFATNEDALGWLAAMEARRG